MIAQCDVFSYGRQDHTLLFLYVTLCVSISYQLIVLYNIKPTIILMHYA